MLSISNNSIKVVLHSNRKTSFIQLHNHLFNLEPLHPAPPLPVGCSRLVGWWAWYREEKFDIFCLR